MLILKNNYFFILLRYFHKNIFYSRLILHIVDYHSLPISLISLCWKPKLFQDFITVKELYKETFVQKLVSSYLIHFLIINA